MEPKGGGVEGSIGLFYCLILSEIETQEGLDSDQYNQYVKIGIHIKFIERRLTVVLFNKYIILLQLLHYFFNNNLRGNILLHLSIVAVKMKILFNQ